MKNLKAINDFARSNGVTIDMDFGYSFGVAIKMRKGNLVHSVLLIDAELSNIKESILTVLKLMCEELKKKEEESNGLQQ